MATVEELKTRLQLVVDDLMEECSKQLYKESSKVLDLESTVMDAEEKVDELKEKLSKPPEWGNCRRGCPPAYLDRERFCSPGCKAGGARGEFYVLPISQAS